ncbi:MAG: hypothetical protein QOH32_1245, partial [Bradyrhizobium sp.]|nr:hypothetical protein [Bradyrhizobium sp.]
MQAPFPEAARMNRFPLLRPFLVALIAV